MIKYKEYAPLVVFVFFAVLSFLVIRPLFLAIFFGALLAYVFFPINRSLQKKIRSKTLSSVIVCIGVFLLLVVPSFFFLKSLVQESYIIFVVAKQKLAIGLFRDCTNVFCEAVRGFSQDPDVALQVQAIFRELSEWIRQKGSQALLSVPRILLNMFVMFFTMFYFLRDGNRFLGKVSDYLSMKEKKYNFIIRRLKEITHGVVYGYLIVALIQGAIGALGFFLFGIQSPLFWGLVMAFLALIPYLGTGVIWIPASIFLFLDGIFQDSNLLLFKGIGLFLYGLILISSLDNFLKPKLMGDKAKIHPAVVLLGIFGGIFLFGPLGVIVGPLILSLTLVLFDAYLLQK